MRRSTNNRNELTASSKANAPSSSSLSASTWLVEHASRAELIKMAGDGVVATFSPCVIVDGKAPMMTEIIMEIAPKGAAA